MKTPDESAMEQNLVEQYLARIGYASYPEQQMLEPERYSRPDFRLATVKEDQATIPNQFKQEFTYQQRSSAAISSRSALQTRGPELREETTSPSILPDTSSPNPWPEREASYQSFNPRHAHNSPSPPSPPARPTETERPARHHHSMLQPLQTTCLELKRQINTCQKQLRNHPSKLKKITKEHDKRIARFLQPAHDEKQDLFEAAGRYGEETAAQEAIVEEMRDIYLQYDRGSIGKGVPNAELVDGLFAVVADTERHVKKAEEANKAAKGRVVRLEDRLYEVKCAMFGMDGGIGGVGDGVVVVEEEGRQSEVGMGRIEGHKPGKKRKARRRKKGARDGQ